MAKKLAEEAIEVVIDAVNGDSDAVVRESADLLYNLTVLWAAAGVKPADVWREMGRREDLLGIAEKMPKLKSAAKPAVKPAVKLPKAVAEDKPLPKSAAAPVVRRRIVTLESRGSRKRH
jgi:phosphoribosyl-ATP pyrophosphohydrolase